MVAINKKFMYEEFANQYILQKTNIKYYKKNLWNI